MAVTHPRRLVQPLLLMALTFCASATSLAQGPACANAYDTTVDGASRMLAFPAEVVWVGEPAQGIAVAEMEDALAASVATWNAVACATVDLRYAGRRTTDELSAGDIVVRFADARTEVCLPQGFLGFTVGCSGHLTVLLEAEAFRWATAPAPLDTGTRPVVDLRAVLTHELGHVLGLGHDDSDARNTMTTRYLRDGGQATLTGIDKKRLCALYPGDANECDPAIGCGPRRACIPTPLGNICDEEKGDVGDYCGAELLICAQTCHFSSPVTLTGYCSTLCQDEPCGPGMRCDEGTCVFDGVDTDDTGCATTGATISGTGPWIIWLLGLWRIRRARS